MERRISDRRQHSWATFHGTLFLSRRADTRRDGDHHDSYIDRYGHKLLIASVSIILLCFADAFFTTILLSRGAVELNLIMDWFIQRDIHMFAAVKMAVTGAALVVLVLHFNFRIYKIIAVRYVLYGLVPLYSLLLMHELHMLSNI